MRVIGIDPGYDRLGVAIIDRTDGKEILRHSTCIETDRSTALKERIFRLGNEFATLVDYYKVDTLAIETLFFNKNLKTAMGVAEVRGALIYIAQAHNCQVFEFGPQEIKVAITGYGKSDKRGVIDMVRRLLPGTPERALDDEYDAIAIALTCLAHHRVE